MQVTARNLSRVSWPRTMSVSSPSHLSEPLLQNASISQSLKNYSPLLPMRHGTPLISSVWETKWFTQGHLKGDGRTKTWTRGFLNFQSILPACQPSHTTAYFCHLHVQPFLHKCITHLSFYLPHTPVLYPNLPICFPQPFGHPDLCLSTWPHPFCT